MVVLLPPLPPLPLRTETPWASLLLPPVLGANITNVTLTSDNTAAFYLEDVYSGVVEWGGLTGVTQGTVQLDDNTVPPVKVLFGITEPLVLTVQDGVELTIYAPANDSTSFRVTAFDTATGNVTDVMVPLDPVFLDNSTRSTALALLDATAVGGLCIPRAVSGVCALVSVAKLRALLAGPAIRNQIYAIGAIFASAGLLTPLCVAAVRTWTAAATACTVISGLTAAYNIPQCTNGKDDCGKSLLLR